MTSTNAVYKLYKCEGRLENVVHSTMSPAEMEILLFKRKKQDLMSVGNICLTYTGALSRLCVQIASLPLCPPLAIF